MVSDLNRDRTDDVVLYYNWLASKISDKCHDSDDFSELLWALFETRFNWRSELDSNWDAEALKMRNSYEAAMGNISVAVWLNGQSSMFEVLVAIATKIETEIMGDPYSKEDTTGEWFWTMINSLGFSFFTDDAYNKKGGWNDDLYVNYIHAYFNADEKHPLFKLESFNPTRPIWGQANDWLREHFDFTKIR